MSLYASHLEPYIIRALQTLLAGQPVPQGVLEHLNGEVLACLKAMQQALREDGVQAVGRVFATLIVDRPWLARLASMQPPGEQLLDLPTRRVRFLEDSEFENRPPRQWLISNILPQEGVALVFGPSGCGKSFLTIDWSLCIATGTPWLGHEVLRGPVAYIAGEGAFGVGARLRAWKTFHHFEGNSGVQWFDQSLVLQDSGNFNEMETSFSEDFAQPPVLVVLDTLSRCSGGAEENSNTDMAKIIAAADVLQQRFHCTVLIVHHAGKDSDRGPRGASALVGNTETIVSVDRTEKGCRVSCYKQKDAPRFEPFALAFQLVQYGSQQEEVSVVLARDKENRHPELRQSEATMLAILDAAEKPLPYGEWIKAAEEAGLKERTASQAIKTLLQTGKVVKNERRYMPTSTQPAEQEMDEEQHIEEDPTGEE